MIFANISKTEDPIKHDFGIILKAESLWISIFSKYSEDGEFPWCMILGNANIPWWLKQLKFTIHSLDTSLFARKQVSYLTWKVFRQN